MLGKKEIMHYCSTIKKNEMVLYMTIWMELEVVLHQMSQAQKDKSQNISFTCEVQKSWIHRSGE